MRKIYTSLMLLAMLMVSMVAKAQYSVVINADPIDGYVAGQQSFDPADIVSALGLEDYSALKTMVDAGGALYLKVGEEKSNVYTGNINEWWMNLEGTPQGYNDEGTSWFVGLECEAAGVDKETGDEWPDRINVYVGQMPGVFSKIYEASTLKATIYLVNGDKQVSFDVTQNVTAAVKPNLPDPTTKLSELTIVADYELKLPFLVGKSYEGKTYSATLEGLYTALGVEEPAVLDASIADYVFTQTVKSEETAPGSGEYIYTPTDDLKIPAEASGGAWYGRYVNYDENEGKEEPLPLSYPKTWGTGANTFYTQGIKLADGEYSIVAGQFPGTLKVGDTDYTYHYIVYGDKAARVKIVVEVTEPETIPFDQMTKAGESTVKVVMEKAESAWPYIDFSFDTAPIAEALGIETSDIDEAYTWASEGVLSNNHTTGEAGGYYFDKDGYISGYGAGSPIYIYPTDIANGEFRFGQHAGSDFITGATEDTPWTTQLIFLGVDKYYVVTIDATIKVTPDEVDPDKTIDDNFGEIVATIPITFEMKPAGDYYAFLSEDEKADAA